MWELCNLSSSNRVYHLEHQETIDVPYHILFIDMMSLLAQVRETPGWCQRDWCHCQISQLSWMFVFVTSPLLHIHLFCILLWLLDVTMRGLSNRFLSVCQPSKSGKTWALDIFIFLYLVWHDVNQGRPVSFSGVYKSSHPHLMHNHGHNASIMVVLQVF